LCLVTAILIKFPLEKTSVDPQRETAVAIDVEDRLRIQTMQRGLHPITTGDEAASYLD
jgi:hypothetical protein